MSWLSNLFSTPKPPPVAPAGQVINEQTAANTKALEQTQAASQIGQQNQYGSQGYTQSGTDQYGNPTYTLKSQLSSPQQALLDQLQGTQSTAGQQAGSLLGGAGYGGMSPTDAIGDMSSGLEGTLIAKQMQQLAPVQQSQREQLDTQLRNQGLFPGSPAYDRQMRDFENNIQNANAANAAKFQDQAFNQSSQLYQMPALMAESLAKFGAPVDLKGTFSNTPTFNAQPTNVSGIYSDVNKANMEQYKQEMANYSSMLNGIFGIGGTVLSGPLGEMLGKNVVSMFGGGGGNIPGTASNGGWSTSVNQPNFLQGLFG